NACLGSSSLTAKEIGFERIAKAIKQLDLSGIILLGGFDAFESLHQFWQAKSEHRELCIPMCMVPVTITNNIPGTEFSVGADSALNEIVNYCDKMKRVARGRTNCVFVVEVPMGKKNWPDLNGSQTSEVFLVYPGETKKETNRRAWSAVK
ncbi:ATP-dependent 6-phosphofructokinase-like, partial [Aplysia californica]|uniref:6-phosphofructokinase n=1 Tax=Aplysia californica TaxID=6500 RepID=A0ABM1VWZ3_APLCA